MAKELNYLEDEHSSTVSSSTSFAHRAWRLVKSRDNWKDKNNDKQSKIKALEVKARDLSVSRDIWKERARRAEAELNEAYELTRLTAKEKVQKKPGK